MDTEVSICSTMGTKEIHCMAIVLLLLRMLSMEIQPMPQLSPILLLPTSSPRAPPHPPHLLLLLALLPSLVLLLVASMLKPVCAASLSRSLRCLQIPPPAPLLPPPPPQPTPSTHRVIPYYPPLSRHRRLEATRLDRMATSVLQVKLPSSSSRITAPTAPLQACSSSSSPSPYSTHSLGDWEDRPRSL